MASNVERNRSLFVFLRDCLLLFADIMYQSAEINTFKANYPQIVKRLDELKGRLGQLESSNPLHYNWIMRVFNCARYLVEATKDMECWNFDTPYLEKAYLFFNSIFENVPEDLQEFMKEGKSEFFYVLDILDANRYALKAKANWDLGNYHQSAANYQEAIQIYGKSNKMENKILMEDLEPTYWFTKGMAYQYEDKSYLEAAEAFKNGSKLFQREAAKATLDERIFDEGKNQSMKKICDHRATICTILHKSVENTPEYTAYRKKYNTTISEYENERQKAVSMTGSREIRAVKELTEEIKVMLGPIKTMKRNASVFGMDEVLATNLYNRATDIIIDLENSSNQLEDIRSRKGTSRQTALDSIEKDKYLRTIRKSILEFNDFLLPDFQQAVEEFLSKREEIEAYAEKERAENKKIPDKKTIEKNLNNAEKEVQEAKSLFTKLKEAYNSAAEFYADAKPYIQKIAGAAKIALACIGFIL